MHAVIFADRDNFNLCNATVSIAPALLPVMGRPVIQHIVESYQQSGAEKIWIVQVQENSSIKETLRSGLRWSIDIEYIFMAENEDYSTLMHRLGDSIQYPCIASRGDVIYKHWLNESQETPLSGNVPASMIVSGINDKSINQLQWNYISHQINGKLQDSRCSDQIRDCDFESLDYYPLQSLVSYHKVSREIISQLESLRIQHGIKKHALVRLGVNSRFNNRCLQKGAVFVDDYSEVHNSARIIGRCYIGKGCIIDRNAELDNCIILDNTYVGPEVIIKNAIVVENTIYRTDLNTSVTIEDDALLSPVNKKNTFLSVGKISPLLSKLYTLLRLVVKTVYLKLYKSNRSCIAE
jgi:NDP-sugar pyrophosphorylase family protein